MIDVSGPFPRGFQPRTKLGTIFLREAAAGLAFLLMGGSSFAQGYDCAGLQGKIAELDRGGGGRGPSRQQLADLARLTTTARGLGCERPEIAFSGGAGGRCPGLNAQILQLQTSINVAQAGGGAADRAAVRADLVAKFNIYCRAQARPPLQPRSGGFFEQLFGIPSAPELPPTPEPGMPDESQQADERPHGGSQAVCVRTCDGGFFPLSVSARHGDPEQLTSLCQALCPNAPVAVYTRAPSRQIDTAFSLEGAPYSEMPNALKFQKSFDPACTCKPPGQSWVEALKGADEVLGGERRGDIVVTPEKSAELSAVRADARTAGPSSLSPAALPAAGASAGQKQDAGQAVTRDVVGPDGVKRRVRIVGPLL